MTDNTSSGTVDHRIADVIRKVVTERSLRKDALDQYLRALTDVEALENRCKEFEKLLAEKDDAIRRRYEEGFEQEQKLKEAIARETAIAKREKRMTDLEREHAVAVAQAEELRKCFNLLFKNVEMRRQVTETVPVVRPEMAWVESRTVSRNESEVSE